MSQCGSPSSLTTSLHPVYLCFTKPRFIHHSRLSIAREVDRLILVVSSLLQPMQTTEEAASGPVTSMRPQAEEISLKRIDLDCFAEEAHLAPLPLCFGFLQIGAALHDPSLVQPQGFASLAATMCRKQTSIANFGICHLQGGRGCQSALSWQQRRANSY